MHYTFSYKSHDEDRQAMGIQFDFDAVSLSEVLTQMECFLKAVGFVPKGTLDFIEDTELNSTNDL